MSVVIETTIGDITLDLYLETRPRTCLNFIKLCKIKYYNFCLFHKIERNFIAQTGDPSGTGRGGHSIFSQMYGEQAKYFEAETKPRIKHKKLGTLSMVNSGNNMNGSQFFITLGEDLTYLDDEHTVFGEVAEGFEILVKLNDTICDTNNRPYQDIRITHTVVLHDPYDDPSNLEIPPSSPIPTKEILASDYVGADEDIEDNKGRSMEEIEEEIKDKEAKARATILEMVGDIPDADVKPPENVLFVCKLNPVTTNEDLEIIFSRFGVINSCEVIKDKKTGESLQYAFIEFDREEDCESAYFKMDNVLIDDRRIHVDFSQSVSKMKFDKQNRPIIESRDNRKRETLVIKDQLRKTGDYEMIFDSDDEGAKGRRDKKKNQGRKHSPSPLTKHKARSPYDHSSKSKYRYRSPYQSSKSKYASESLPYNSSKSKHHSKSPLHNSSKSRHRGKSPPRNSSKCRHHSKSPPHNSSKSRHRSKSPSYKSSKSRHHSKSPPHNSSKSRYRSKSPSHNSSKSNYDKPSHHSSKSKLRSRSPRHKHKKSRKDLSSPEPNSPPHSLSKRKKHSHYR